MNNNIDYRHWASLDSWSLKEAAFLFAGLNPSDYRAIRLNVADVPVDLELARKVHVVLSRANWATRFGRHPHTVKSNPLFMAIVVMESGVTIPEALHSELKTLQERKQAAENRGDTGTTAEAVTVKERNAMLKLIIGFAMGGYGYDPDAPKNRLAGAMRADMEKHGVPLDDETIKKYLTEARKHRKQILAKRFPQ